MKILFYQWHSFMNRGIERALQKLDIPYETLFFQQEDWEKDQGLVEKLKKKLTNKENGAVFDAVLSVNFAPVVSNTCQEMGIPYISWIYDSPLHLRDLSAMKNQVNHIYHFDRGQAEVYRQAGITAEHLPLAADAAVFDEAIGSVKLRPVVSLLGRLYQTDYAGLTAPLADYTKGYLEGIVNAQLQVYGAYLVPELVTDALLEEINGQYRARVPNGFQIGRRELEYLLACETTARERYMAAALLSGHFDMEIYGDERDERLSGVRFCGYADYYGAMPGVFASSAVNLNMSLKTIRTGIPLRVIDIMACGGFCITNQQEELFEYFEVGNELVVYRDMEDLYEKTGYYLSHEDERTRIAKNGRLAVETYFRFEQRLQKMLAF